MIFGEKPSHCAQMVVPPPESDSERPPDWVVALRERHRFLSPFVLKRPADLGCNEWEVLEQLLCSLKKIGICDILWLWFSPCDCRRSICLDSNGLHLMLPFFSLPSPVEADRHFWCSWRPQCPLRPRTGQTLAAEFMNCHVCFFWIFFGASSSSCTSGMECCCLQNYTLLYNITKQCSQHNLVLGCQRFEYLVQSCAVEYCEKKTSARCQNCKNWKLVATANID